MNINKFIPILMIFISSCSYFQNDKTKLSNIQQADSIKIKGVVEDFYSWYGKAIKSDSTIEFQPHFIRDNNGMASLDFDPYFINLKENGFSNRLLEKTRQDFSKCMQNLDSIPYDTLMAFDAIDNYESIGCDFFNYYNWTMEMEPHDGADVVYLKELKSDSATIVLKLFSQSEGKDKFYWDYKVIEASMVKIDNLWKIDDIDIELTNK